MRLRITVEPTFDGYDYTIMDLDRKEGERLIECGGNKNLGVIRVRLAVNINDLLIGHEEKPPLALTDMQIRHWIEGLEKRIQNLEYQQ